MITHLLDANAMIALLGRKSPPLVERITESDEARSHCRLRTLLRGIQERQVSFNLETPRLALSDFPVLGYERKDAERSGAIRAELAARGTPIGPLRHADCGIQARHLILVTNNVREFSMTLPGRCCQKNGRISKNPAFCKAGLRITPRARSASRTLGRR